MSAGWVPAAAMTDWPTARWLAAHVPHNTAGRAVTALVPIVIGTVVYFAAARLMRLPELGALIRRRK